MMRKKHIPYIWSKKEIEYLKKWYPHFGGKYVAEKLNIPVYSVNLKVSNINRSRSCSNLRMLPKNQRVCIKCKIANQVENKNGVHRLGYYCRKCANKKRYIDRRTKDVSVRDRFNELLRTARARSSVPCDLTIEYLLELLEKQEGKCYYSGIKMDFYQWGKGREKYSISLDQIKPSKGYTKNNVSLCCWAVNRAKSALSMDEYIHICKCVAEKNGGI